jgi:hypothetical protein
VNDYALRSLAKAVSTMLGTTTVVTMSYSLCLHMDRQMIVDDVGGFFFFLFSLSLSSIRTRSLFFFTLVLSVGLLSADGNTRKHTHTHALVLEKISLSSFF